MRVLLAVVFACALGLPAASALPASGSHWEKASGIVQVDRHGKSSAHRQGRSHGGIHSLVGSGDY